MRQQLAELTGRDISLKPTGRMYEVNIKADPNDFLDWDKPLSQQSEKARAALNSQQITDALKESYRIIPDQWEQSYIVKTPGGSVGGMTRAEAEKTLMEMRDQASLERSFVDDMAIPMLSKYTGGPDKMAAALREAGIPGIKYLDQGSRGAGEGSSNYVVFDEDLIEILKKYSNPPTASIPSLATGQGEDDPFIQVLHSRYGVQ